MYLINSFVFFFVGGHPRPGRARRSSRSPASSWSARQFYNQAFTMHATFMLFLFIIPILAGFGNYVVPLQIGAPDMAFPRINALSLWLLPLGGLLMASGFFVSGGSAASGWTEYPPLSGGQVQRHGHGPVDHRPRPDRDELDPGRDQLPRHDLQDARAGHDAVPDADPRLDRPRDERPRADGDAGPHERADHAVHRPQLRRPLLRPGQRRQRGPVPERLLVLLAPGGLHHGPAGDGHHQRGPPGLHAQAAVRLQGVRVRDGRHRRPRLLGLGAPHVHDGRGVPAVLQPHDVPDRGADGRQDVQLDRDAVARQAGVQDAAAVRASAS